MLHWWQISYWANYSALVCQRERLALLLWPYLSKRERSEDDAAALWLLSRMVRTIESGRADFPEDEVAQQLWGRANADSNIQSAAADLQTIRQQLTGFGNEAAVQVAPFGSRQLKPLQNRMKAERLETGVQWLHAPITLPLLSTLFLCSGWMFNTIFFRHFGLPVGNYFGLSDYLAASLDGLIPAAIAVIVTFLIQWMARGSIRLQALQNRVGSWRNIFKAGLVLVVALPLAALALGTQEPAEQRLIIIYMWLLLFSISVIQILISVSRRPTRDVLLLSFTLFYVIVIWYTAELRFLNLDEATDPVEVILAAAPDRPLRARIISGNSLYLFLMNEQREVVTVPVEQVLSVRYPGVAVDPVENADPAR